MNDKLSLQEKRPLVFMIIDIVVFFCFHLCLLSLSYKREFEATEDLSFWAMAILSLIPLLIVARIVFYLLFSIMNTFVTKQKEEKFLVDELGGIIKLKAGQFFSNTFLLGFLVSISLLLFGKSASAMFTGFLFSIYAAFILQHLSEFYYLRKGTTI